MQKSANFPIIEITSNGSILNTNHKVKEVIKGKVLAGKNICDMLQKSLSNLQDNHQEIEQKLKDFFKLDDHNQKRHHEISLSPIYFQNPLDKFEEDHLYLKLYLILRYKRHEKKSELGDSDRTVLGAFLLFEDKSFHCNTQNFTYPMPLDTHHLIEQGEVFMTVNEQALTHAHAGAYLVSFH